MGGRGGDLAISTELKFYLNDGKLDWTSGDRAEVTEEKEDGLKKQVMRIYLSML
jgi:hypothetical protein